MYETQRTLARAVSLEGIGLHTGEHCCVRVQPAPEQHGIVFRRVDLPGQPLVPAHVDYALEEPRATVLARDEAKVITAEHLLAALMGLQIDNVLIDLEGPELPILDGSAQPYINLLKEAGIDTQKATRNFIELQDTVQYSNGDKKAELTIFPASEFRATVLVDYETQVLGAQNATLHRLEEFEQELGHARTFCFLHEIEPMLKAGLIKGGTLDNALVFVDQLPDSQTEAALRKIFSGPITVAPNSPLNHAQLHQPNEPARHKLMDLIGDLALVGAPLKGHVVAHRPGHASNIGLARAILKRQQFNTISQSVRTHPHDGFRFDVNNIMKMLPHRFPFLMIDRITYMDERVVEGYKNVSVNEPFFQGHFPGNPVMPGVLQLEAMAQVGGVLVWHSVPDPDSLWMFYMGVENARFRRPVVPGDQLFMRLELESIRRNIIKMRGKAVVGDQLTCEASLQAALVPKDRKPR